MEGFANVMNPAQGTEAGKGSAPIDPQDKANRVSGWKRLLTDLQNNPAKRNALLYFGVAMTQPPRPGDNFTSQLGRSVGVGANYLQMEQQARQRQGNVEAERGLEAQRTQASVAESGARTEATKEGTRQSRESFPLEQSLRQAKVKELMGQIKNLDKIADIREKELELRALQLELERYKLEAEKAIPTDARAQKAVKELEALEAEIEARKAATSASRASAAGTRAKTKAFQEMSPQEQTIALGGAQDARIAAINGLTSSLVWMDEAGMNATLQRIADIASGKVTPGQDEVAPPQGKQNPGRKFPQGDVQQHDPVTGEVVPNQGSGGTLMYDAQGRRIK